MCRELLIIMVQKKNGSSLDFIIHPGQSLEEILQLRNMSQNELAIRTGVSAKHISKVISGESNISYMFAKRLEYALSIDKQFWINLQEEYDKELLEYIESNSVTQEEIKIAEKLCFFTEHLQKNNFLPTCVGDELILNLRKFLKVSTLESIPQLVLMGSFKIKENQVPDVYGLFAWQELCQQIVQNLDFEIDEVKPSEQKRIIKSFLSHFKALMSFESSSIIPELQKLFARCGIVFCVAPSFKEVPAVGFIKQISPTKTIMCITIDESNPDEFWFTVFHEIGHIINGDVRNQFTDINTKPELEQKADNFAKKILAQRSL